MVSQREAAARVAQQQLAYEDAIRAYDELIELHEHEFPRLFQADPKEKIENYERLRSAQAAARDGEAQQVKEFVKTTEALESSFDLDRAVMAIELYNWVDRATQGPIHRARELLQKLHEQIRAQCSPSGPGPEGRKLREALRAGNYRAAFEQVSKYLEGCHDPIDMKNCRELKAEIQNQAREALEERVRAAPREFHPLFTHALLLAEFDRRFGGVLSRKEFESLFDE
jgi:hypothetical protein